MDNVRVRSFFNLNGLIEKENDRTNFSGLIAAIVSVRGAFVARYNGGALADSTSFFSTSSMKFGPYFRFSENF